jgi:hypothetical protein
MSPCGSYVLVFGHEFEITARKKIHPFVVLLAFDLISA